MLTYSGFDVAFWLICLFAVKAAHSAIVVVVQWLGQVCLFATTWTAAHQAFLSFTISQSLLKLRSVELVTPSYHLFLCHPLLLLSSIFPSIRVFSNKSVLHIRWPKYWSFSFISSPSNEYSELISFRIDGLISLLSKRLSRVLSSATVRKHPFFSAQLSLWSNCHIYTWPIHDLPYTLPLDIWNFILWHPTEPSFPSSVAENFIQLMLLLDLEYEREGVRWNFYLASTSRQSASLKSRMTFWKPTVPTFRPPVFLSLYCLAHSVEVLKDHLLHGLVSSAIHTNMIWVKE